VLREIGRVTKSGGALFVREPCSSMGSWCPPRLATPNERGIPKRLMTRFARAAGFELISVIPILFEPLNKILKRTIGFRVPFPVLYAIDRGISSSLSWNDHYWRDTFSRKLGPSSYYYLFHKP
jgi:hypothetical protein